MVRDIALALLMAIAVILISAAPIAQCEPADVHEIVKDENGPPSACTETWELTPSEDWTWHGHIVNDGLRWLIIDVLDTETGDIMIDREMYRFALYPEGWVDTEDVHMAAGHTYFISATPNGPLGTSCTVEDILEGPPVAAFTLSVDGLTVSVDASSSYDPDGTIVSYEWDWGDGSIGTGMISSHTYIPLQTETMAVASAGTRPLLEPRLIFGCTYDVDGIPLPCCTVRVTNVRTGLSGTTTSWNDGVYGFDLTSLGEPWTTTGDLILVEAYNDMLYGSAFGTAPLELDYTIIDVTLDEELPGPFSATITLTVTDNDGLTSTVSQTVELYP